MKNRWLKLVIFIMVLCTISGFSTHAENGEQTIKVGYFEGGDFMYKGNSGDYEGFNFEYLYEIAKYTGWKYQVVETGSWEEAWQMLEDGEIDILPSVYYTSERAKEVGYSSLPTALPICSIYTVLNVRQDDLRYHYADYEAFDKMKVGVIEASKDAGNFAEYCRVHGISPDIVPFGDTAGLIQALEDGELDGIAVTHLGKNPVFRTVAQFAPEPLYIGVAPGKQEILNQLNDGMETLRIRNPEFEARMYAKYFSVGQDQKPVFTKDEQDFIKQSQTITAVCNPAFPPIEYTDGDGRFIGITADLFQDISSMTGLQFQFIPAEDEEEARRMLASGAALIDCGISGDYLSYYKDNVRATEYYLTAPMVLITNGADKINTMAVLDGTAMTERMTADRKNVEFTYCSSLEQCFEMLRDGHVDAVFTNTYTADYFLSRPAYRQFKIAMLLNYPEEFSIGVSDGADMRLFSVLNKCLQYMSAERMNEIILKNSIIPETVTLKDFVMQNPLEVVFGTLAAFLAVTAVLLYALFVKSKSSRQISRLMYTDDLTGIWNLSKFRIEAEAKIKNAKSGSYVLLYADIKQFKMINDTFGFNEGDELLCLYAEAVKEVTESGECYARVSADQFVLLLKYKDWDQVLERTAAIEARLNGLVKSRNKKYFLVLCFGAYIITEPDKNISWMLDQANYARRSIKTEHKSKTVLYDENMRRQELLQKELSDQMDRAVREHEFVCYFQPKVNMATREIIGSEALVRWNHPEKGLMLPGAFVPYFEQNGLITEIDFYVYEEVCRNLHKWLGEDKNVMPVSCNFSRLHFRDDKFTDKLIEIADKYQIPYRYLELEMTEGMLMEDADQVIKMFTKLKEKGFTIDIDDFGTGYSSLGLLQRMPVDVIKLDRSFLTESLDGTREQCIIHSVVELSENLKLEVICEGVETEMQAVSLMTLGCFHAQGFYYAKPVPAKEFEKMMEKGCL